jgi:sugar phosphate isomerase/epimerase
MVTGDFAIPENSDEAPQALRNITPYLELAEALEADLLRVGIKRVEDIAWAQRAADEAGERGMRLAHQSHTASPFETLAGSLETLKRIDRRNFGVIYEPANLELCGDDYGPETIKWLSASLFDVYVQNHVLNPDGQDEIATWAKGKVRFDRIPVWEEGGIDFPLVLGTLEEIGYEGYVTVHQASVGEGDVEEAVRESARYLRSLADFGG